MRSKNGLRVLNNVHLVLEFYIFIVAKKCRLRKGLSALFSAGGVVLGAIDHEGDGFGHVDGFELDAGVVDVEDAENFVGEGLADN